MVNDSGQLFTIEGVAAGILMLTTAYLVLSTTSIYTPAETHISDMQLEQLGSDALALMDTPYSSAGAGGGMSEIASYIQNNQKSEFAIRLNELLSTNGSDNVRFNSTIYYRNDTTGLIHSYPFSDTTLIGTNWSQVKSTSPNGWSARNAHASVTLDNGHIILLGGYNGEFKNDVWKSTDQGRTWTEVIPTGLKWSPRSGHSAVNVVNDIYIMGGQGNGLYNNEVWKSTDEGVSWTEVIPTGLKWSARSGQSCVVRSDNSFVLIGGFDGSSKNDTWWSSDMGATWTQSNTSAIWSARSGQSCVALPDNTIRLMGGYENGTRYKNDVWRSTDYGAGNWTLVKSAAEWSPRATFTSVIRPDNSHIVLMGGENSAGFLNDVWRSADDGATWLRMTEGAGWTVRAYHTSVVMPDGNIILMGGEDSGINKNDVWRSSDSGAVWENRKDNDAVDWSARKSFSTVFLSDNSILLMGGQDGSGYKNDVWLSGNNGRNWTQVASGSAWSARSGFASVVLPDDSILITGGIGSSGLNRDVWKSEDRGKTWMLMTPVGASWPPRSDHTCVVLSDGSIVLMGGDVGGGNPINDVWRSIDNGVTWTQVPDAGVIWPSRYGHSSGVLPGDRIIVMGGRDLGGYKNDVWSGSLISNPGLSATWTQEVPGPGPKWSARAFHTSSVLPDSSVILMGGQDSGGYKSDVWRSSDNGKNWIEMTSSPGWSPRYAHSSVGLVIPPGNIIQIVLMGGQDNSRLLNDVWESTSRPVISNRERMMTVSRLVQVNPPLAIPGIDNRNQTVLLEVSLWKD